MSDLDMDAAPCPLDLSRVPSNFITMLLQSMSLSDRLKCALVCKAWADEAAAATHSIILRDSVQDLSCLQSWLEKHGGQVEVLQLHDCSDSAMLTALPCPQLQDLLAGGLSLDSRVWSDIAAATKLTSVSLEMVWTDSQQADVVSALTALPDLEQLTWRSVEYGQQWGLTDSKLLQDLTKLTALKLGFDATTEALEHLGLLTRLQDFRLDATLAATGDWVAAGCPGLQELKALTRLELSVDEDWYTPPNCSQLTALQQLEVPAVTPTELHKLSVLTGLTGLCVEYLEDLRPESPPLQLSGLKHLKVAQGMSGTMSMSFLGSCTQLQVLELCNIYLSGPGSLVTSSMLQHLKLHSCRFSAADGAAGPASWQQVFPGPGRLPHLTSLHVRHPKPDLGHADFECVVACCSSLQVLHLQTLPNGATSTLARLPDLTSLMLWEANDQLCSSVAQLTRLRALGVYNAREVFAAGLRQLAALEQLTSLGLQFLGWSSDVLREHMADVLPGPFMYEYHGLAIVNQVGMCVVAGGHSHCHQDRCCCGL